MRRRTVAIGCLVLVPAAAGAQTTRAAIDPDSPTGVVQSWLLALDGREPGKAGEILLSTTAQEADVAAAMGELAAAMGKLRVAAIEQFGNKATRLLGNESERFSAMTERVNGDRATVRVDAGTALQLVRVNGRWRIPVAQVINASPDVAERVAKVRVMAQSLARIAEDVAADRFHTADEAAQAMQEEVIRSAVRQNQPATTTAVTTSAATAPATAPVAPATRPSR